MTMPDPNRHIPEGMTAEQRDAQVSADNEVLRVARHEILTETEAGNALRALLPAEAVARILREGAHVAEEVADVIEPQGEPTPATDDESAGE